MRSTATTPLLLQLTPAARTALERFIAEEWPDLTPHAAGSYLLEHQLIGMGLLALPGKERATGARRG